MENEYYINAHICMTRDIGTHGNLFGGIMLSWLDEAAAIFARRYAGEKHMVTLRFSELLFREPVHVGEMIEFFALNPRLGRTSITMEIVGRVGVREIVHTTTTFVAVGDDGKPKVIEKSDK
ncbi:hypothetical protein K8I28_12835 [bacterium]|nr:hypothetical protein [bacterium]